MAETNGKLVTCDRCGKQVFLKCVGEGEADGGFTRWNKFENFPEGWEYHCEVGRLCPDCNGKYKNLVNTFMSEVRGSGREPN
jgi:hypothetical protein